MSKIADYQQEYISFFGLLRNTRKYRELLKDHAGIFSIIFATIFTYIVHNYIIANNEYLNKTIDPLILSFSAGLLSLLGVYIAGMAIFMSIITPNTIKNLDEKNSVHNLVGIFFSFYFIGAFILFTILLFIVGYLRVPINLALEQFLSKNVYYFITNEGIIAYLWVTLFAFFFSISYTVALLGTCINFFFANLYMDKVNDKMTNRKEDADYIYIVQVKKLNNKKTPHA